MNRLENDINLKTLLGSVASGPKEDVDNFLRALDKSHADNKKKGKLLEESKLFIEEQVKKLRDNVDN